MPDAPPASRREVRRERPAEAVEGTLQLVTRAPAARFELVPQADLPGRVSEFCGGKRWLEEAEGVARWQATPVTDIHATPCDHIVSFAASGGGGTKKPADGLILLLGPCVASKVTLIPRPRPSPVPRHHGSFSLASYGAAGREGGVGQPQRPLRWVAARPAEPLCTLRRACVCGRKREERGRGGVGMAPGTAAWQRLASLCWLPFLTPSVSPPRSRVHCPCA